MVKKYHVELLFVISNVPLESCKADKVMSQNAGGPLF